MTEPMKHPIGSRSPNEYDKQVGEKIRQLRVRRSMTLQGLAEAVGVSHQQLQKYETGSNRLSAGMVPIVANALGVGILDLFERADTSGDGNKNEAERLREECQIWLRRVNSENTLRVMSRVLKVLAS